MGAETRTQQYSQQTLRQVRLDSNRAMIRARFCPERAEVMQLRCMDDRMETETSFGNQLWYFEGIGVDEYNRQRTVYGAIEYSMQFGLNELVEDGVFDSEDQRDRFRHVYEREIRPPSLQQPGQRWLALGLVAVTAIWLTYLLVRTLMH
ncbi:hypothetical protein [Stieleria varia]|uniref:Uncharacterized protein n=1 Tax=Stieleria varia TaxID=2528005 RepID=A0A5C6B7K2_9BACT|nr:hypothetical protein [Stieleria varia]TWU08043.1 hypothetical protein Pla52n_06210 [Stieleria varia]